MLIRRFQRSPEHWKRCMNAQEICVEAWCTGPPLPFSPTRRAQSAWEQPPAMAHCRHVGPWQQLQAPVHIGVNITANCAEGMLLKAGNAAVNWTVAR